jgi:hypothetical protein
MKHTAHYVAHEYYTQRSKTWTTNVTSEYKNGG